VIEALRGKSFSVVDDQDVMAGVDWMVSRGYVDPDRIALLGQSAGAHRANVLLPRTKRFRVAISNEGWANAWIADSTGENTGRWEWPINVWLFRGTRLENPEAWFDEDPLQRLHEVTTPTLLIAGTAELGGIGGMTNEYFFSVLKRRGVDTKLIQFPDEGHGLTKVANRRYLMQAAIDWVEGHLGMGTAGGAR
jgi:dipeptidyl aminopeptidase/acylaminoacyl peptidase